MIPFIDKNIILFGCGNTARNFYRKHSDSLSIRGCVSNNIKETELVINGSPVLRTCRPDELKQFSDALIVICSIAGKEIKKQLLLMGYQPFKDFVDSSFLELLMQEKKIVLSYGVCHIRALTECLEKTTVMKQNYEFFYFDNYLPADIEKQFMFQFLLDKCSVFIYSLGISKEEYTNNACILMRVSSKARIISVPTVTFSGYFPKKDARVNHLNEFSVQSVLSNYTPFSFGDEKINQMLKEHKGEDEIIKQTQHTWEDETDWVQKNCERELKKIEAAEAYTDLKISAFIKENYQKRRLFRNEAHMENEVIIQLAKQVLVIMGISPLLEEELLEEPLLKCSQHLIYPQVAEALKLKWDVHAVEYDLFTYHGWKKVHYDEFLKEYINYCNTMKSLIENGLIPEVEG